MNGLGKLSIGFGGMANHPALLALAHCYKVISPSHCFEASRNTVLKNDRQSRSGSADELKSCRGKALKKNVSR